MRQIPGDCSIGFPSGVWSALQATANTAYNSVLPFSIEKIHYFYYGPITIMKNPVACLSARQGFPRPKS